MQQIEVVSPSKGNKVEEAIIVLCNATSSSSDVFVGVETENSRNNNNDSSTISLKTTASSQRSSSSSSSTITGPSLFDTGTKRRRSYSRLSRVPDVVELDATILLNSQNTNNDDSSISCSCSESSYDTNAMLPAYTKKQSPHPDKLLNKNRRVRQVGRRQNLIYRDGGPAIISRTFVEELKKKAILLHVVTAEKWEHEGKRGSDVNVHEGQAGLLIFGRTSTGSAAAAADAVLVTSLHNVQNGTTSFDGKQYVCCGHDMEIMDQQFPHVQFQNTSSTGQDNGAHDEEPFPLRDGQVWKHGFDITYGQSVSQHPVLQWTLSGLDPSQYAHNVVDRGFKTVVGMKIGIVVYSHNGATIETALGEGGDPPRNDERGDNEIDLENIYGPPNSVAIYTGEITHVGKGYFEHNINTYRGCSGAVVFLLDVGQYQPKEVHTKYSRCYKNAIGVHAGHHDGLGANIAFKLSQSKGWRTRHLLPWKK